MTGELPLLPWAQKTTPSAIQKMLMRSAEPGVISFALGLPSEEVFPLSNFKDAVTHTIDKTARCLQYSPPLQLLKEHIVELMKLRGVECKPEEVFLTSGAQQGMSLLSRLFIEPNANVLVDELTYSGFVQSIESLHPTFLTIPINHRVGIDLDVAELYCKHKKPPQLMYTIAEGHNPLGISMAKLKRSRLTELARTYRMPIIEDDTYGFLNYQDALPSIKSYCPKWVFYVGSFSKVFAPSLRVGWLVVPEELIEKLEILKEGSDINTATFAQRSLLRFIEAGHLPEHLSKIRQTYKEKRDTMLAHLNKYLPELECSSPNSGFFIWGQLPGEIDTTKLFWNALNDEKVAFLPGSAFDMTKKGNFNNCLRLSFSHCPLTLIEDGVKRLARAVNKLRI